MVAELLRLRLRILANGLRRPVWQLLGIFLALVLAVAAIVALWVGAAWVSGFDERFAGEVTVLVGSWLSLAALLLPASIVRSEGLSPRAFLGYGFSPLAVGAIFLLFALLGPLLLLIPVALLPLGLAVGDEALRIAWTVAPLLFFSGLLSIKIGARVGVGLRHRPRQSGWLRVGTVFALVPGPVLLAILVVARIPASFGVANVLAPALGSIREALSAVIAVLAASPFGVLWAAPGYAGPRLDSTDLGWQAVGFAALWVLALLVAWLALVGLDLKATRKHIAARAVRVPGWFGRVPETPAGAVAARSLSYWVRDPRYFSIFAVIPVITGLMLLTLSVGGVAFEVAVLVPLPVATLLLSWVSLHNDVAFDNTAIWQHVSAQTRGADDRWGRTVPVLAAGAVLLAVGIPLTVWGAGDIEIAPPLTGVCVALLLGGVGVASFASARFPYPTTRPGDPAWQAPQVAGSQGGVAQTISVFLVVLVAVPAAGAALLWGALGGAWGWVSLVVGIASGLAVLVTGIRRGGELFDRRAPELLAFTLRS